jgi:hypothetical protein
MLYWIIITIGYFISILIVAYLEKQYPVKCNNLDNLARLVFAPVIVFYLIVAIIFIAVSSPWLLLIKWINK